MKKLLLGIMVLLGLAGCGNGVKKSNLVTKLGSKAENITKYQADAVMTIHRPDSKTSYILDIKYLADDFYSVKLTSQENNSSQTILKNESGVYVLNPSLNKCFKFNNNWPLGSSNGYMFHSIVKDIVNDQKATITSDKDHYFVLSKVSHKTNYNWDSQKVSLNKKTLLPTEVLIYNENKEVLVDVVFKSFNLKPELTKNSFDQNKLMQETLLELGEGQMESSGYLEPTYLPVSSSLEETKKYPDKQISAYKGNENFVLIQEMMSSYQETAEEMIYGEPIILDIAVGILTDNSLSWFKDGIMYTIFSVSMDNLEMISIANSFE